MNRRQWWVLAMGTLATVLVPVLGTTRLRPPIVGPIVEHASGYSSVDITDAVTPKWAVLVSLGLAGLTAAVVYKCRSHGAA